MLNDIQTILTAIVAMIYLAGVVTGLGIWYVVDRWVKRKGEE